MLGRTSTGDASSLRRKRELRWEMRGLRRALPDRPQRSAQIRSLLEGLDAVRRARRVLGFTTIEGEPEMAEFLAACRERGASAAVPEDELDPSWPDVVIVPGLAFTQDGHRLGQGGGWYDRFLASTGDRCVSIGVCFHEQLHDAIPIEAHDVAVDVVVTDRGVIEVR